MICTSSPLPILPAHQTPLLTPFLGEGTPSVHPWSSQCHLLELGPRSHRSLQRQHHNGEVGGVGLARVCDHQPRPSWASQALGVHQGRAGSAETLIWLLEGTQRPSPACGNTMRLGGWLRNGFGDLCVPSWSREQHRHLQQLRMEGPGAAPGQPAQLSYFLGGPSCVRVLNVPLCLTASPPETTKSWFLKHQASANKASLSKALVQGSSELPH